MSAQLSLNTVLCQVWPVDGIQVGEASYHQSCVVCTQCALGPDAETKMVLGPKDRFRKMSSTNQVRSSSSWVYT